MTKEKRCPTCKKRKPLSAFYKNGASNARCKECQRTATLAGYYALKERLPEGFPPAPSKGCKRCGKAKPGSEFYRQKWAASGLSAWCKACVRARDLQRQYGIDPDEYERLFSAQRGVCALCLRPPKAGRGLAVDHCHDTEKVRGLLCSQCNTALGKFPTVEILKRAIAYLRK